MEGNEGLDAAALAGRILLQNGAEIFRVEETIERIAKSYGLEGNSSFVLSSGIFITEEKDDKHFYANVKHIPLSTAHLDKVAAVNQLSREIETGKYTPGEAIEELHKIQNMPENPKVAQVIAAGVGSGCFAYVKEKEANDKDYVKSKWWHVFNNAIDSGIPIGNGGQPKSYYNRFYYSACSGCGIYECYTRYI